MTRAKRPQNNFSGALRKSRSALGIAQEAFSLASSRTYVSSLERGLKSPTLNKVDALSEVLDIHPLTLLALSYMNDEPAGTADALLNRVSKELSVILNAKK